MAVAYDSSDQLGGGGTETSPYNSPFSNGSGTYMTATLTTTSAISGVAITYNGVSMTPVQGEAGASPFQYVFVLANPATGSNTLTATWSGGGANNFGVMPMTFTGVGSLGTIDHNTFVSGTTSFSTTVTLGANDMLAAYGVYANGTAGNMGVSVGTLRQKLDTTSTIATSATNTGTGSIAVTYTRAIAGAATVVGMPLLAPIPANGNMLLVM